MSRCVFLCNLSSGQTTFLRHSLKILSSSFFCFHFVVSYRIMLIKRRQLPKHWKTSEPTFTVNSVISSIRNIRNLTTISTPMIMHTSRWGIVICSQTKRYFICCYNYWISSGSKKTRWFWFLVSAGFYVKSSDLLDFFSVTEVLP